MKNGNAIQTFREVMKLVLQVIEELPIKNKTAGSVGAPQREKVFFYNIHFA